MVLLHGSGTNKISGLAWYDADKDGQRDDDEAYLSGLTVYLISTSDLNIVSKTSTSSTGAYTFTGVTSGESYIVLIEYDTSNYNVTTYQADNVDSSCNSDFINIALTLSGVYGTYAVSNTITLSADTYNIDLGLVDTNKFDLELTKTVSLIQVSNSSGTTSYKFDKSTLAKVEIASKAMSGSVVAITYTFTVTNTGDVAGYANKLVDYLPSDLSFSSALNPDWYQDTDGNLYCSTLNGVLINPGESKEISLILTKTMTTENTGLVNNTAEIYEASNDEGISDTDSTPANKSTSEDDYGSADVIIAVKTGGAVAYIGITLGVLAVFALRSIYNKEKSFNENIEGKEVKIK